MISIPIWAVALAAVLIFLAGYLLGRSWLMKQGGSIIFKEGSEGPQCVFKLDMDESELCSKRRVYFEVKDEIDISHHLQGS